MTESQTVLGMFARYPEPGRTKTRLAATIGDHAAAKLYTAFVEDLASRLPNLAQRFVVAATPAEERTISWFHRLLDGSGDVLAQPEGSLGTRIRWFFDTEDSARNRVVLLGSDSPDIPADIVTSAFDELRTFDVVIAPATDGGYVLIGLRVAPGTLFDEVAWSSSSTLQDTLTACAKHHLTVRLLQPWYDVDQAENLGTLKSLQMTPESPAAKCPQTTEFLKQL